MEPPPQVFSFIDPQQKHTQKQTQWHTGDVHTLCLQMAILTTLLGSQNPYSFCIFPSSEGVAFSLDTECRDLTLPNIIFFTY